MKRSDLNLNKYQQKELVDSMTFGCIWILGIAVSIAIWMGVVLTILKIFGLI